MFRVSLLLSCFMLPALLPGQTTIPLSSSGAGAGQSAQGGQSAPPTAAPTPTRDRPAATQITLEQAITMALANSPSIKAARTQIQQNQAQEITANLRPNPTLSWDSQFIPVFNPGDFSTDTLNNLQQLKFDLEVVAFTDISSLVALVADGDRVLKAAKGFLGKLQRRIRQQYVDELLGHVEGQGALGISNLGCGNSGCIASGL